MPEKSARRRAQLRSMGRRGVDVLQAVLTGVFIELIRSLLR